MNDYKQAWRKKSREYLAVAFGGKCTICGYDKTIAALDYHHVDPKQKNVLLCIAMSNGHAWSKIIQEAKKCTIVCCRCHREIHAGITELPSNYARFNDEYEDVIKLKQKEFDECPICGEEKLKKLKYCSPECSANGQKKFEINKEDLERLIAEKPYEEIGKIFGVSGNAIKKRCKSLGIKTCFRKGFWSKQRKKELGLSKEDLAELLKTNSMMAISRMFEINYETVRSQIKEYGLEVPKINWHQIAGKARWGEPT